MSHQPSSGTIRLRGKDGREYVGTPRDCALVLMADALQIYLRNQLHAMALWEAEDFCRQFDIDPRDIRRELKDPTVI